MVARTIPCLHGIRGMPCAIFTLNSCVYICLHRRRAADPVLTGNERSGWHPKAFHRLNGPLKTQASFPGVFAYFQHRQESLLWYVHLSDPLHALLAFLLLFQQLALATDVTAVALGEHILTQGGYRLPSHDLRSDCRLDRHFELLPRNQLPHFRYQCASTLISEV